MINNEMNGKIIRMVQILLESVRRSSEVTASIIIEKLNLVVALNPEWGGADKDYLLDELIRLNSIVTGTFHKLGDDTDHIKWYTKEQKEKRDYWDRYRSYLDGNLPWNSVESIDEVTDSIMSDLESPDRNGAWDRRGLVVGHVQSGKTSNYTGLICKAADAGYKIIIVLAGLHNNLRSQTQARLDEGFLGYETNPDKSDPNLTSLRWIGVGEINSDPKLRPQWVTTRLEKGDFNAKVAQNLGVTPEERPWLFVVKKQKNVLQELLKWLKNHVADSVDPETGEKSIGRLPLIMIDDEADHASVDTGEEMVDGNGEPDLEHQPKTINSLVRQVLKLFQKKSYIGYTATPFANIFIHNKGKTKKEGSDLFPSAFIYNIPAPSNYIGPSKVFGTLSENGRDNALPLTVAVDDYTDQTEKDGWMPPKHSKEHIPFYPNSTNLPKSLTDAIDSFLLSCAARNLRGMRHKHSSMLIHVTRYQLVQNSLKSTVESYIKGMKQRIDRKVDYKEIKERLESLWVNDFIYKTEKINTLNLFDELPLHSWNEIWIEVKSIINEVEVRAINGSAKDALDYVDAIEAKRIIAIGGDKLSRGLTLEGLVTSYFLRASKMYDTLMQMGRWFGYRDGYIDLCRLYTTGELIDWFEHITDAAEELREEFDYMVQTGSKPLEYGLRVQSHSTLLVTSRLKMRNGKVMQLSYSGELSETVAFSTDPQIIKANRCALNTLVEGIGIANKALPIEKGASWNAYRWDAVSSDYIISFFNSYKSHDKSYKVNTKLLSQFIEKMNRVGELLNWNVAIFNGSYKHPEHLNNIPGHKIYPVQRAERTNSDLSRFSIGRLLGSKDEAVDLTTEEWKNVIELSTEKNTLNGPGMRRTKSLLRGKTAEGLLLLYLVVPKKKGEVPSVFDEPYVGFGVSFPSSNAGEKVEYVVNAIGQDDYA